MWKNLPIRIKLSMVIAASLLLSVIISTTISNNAMRDMMMGRIEVAEIPASLDAVSNAIAKEINTPLAISKAIAQNTFLQTFQQQGEPQDQLAEIQRYLKTMQEENNAITAYLVSGKTNRYYTQEGLDRVVSTNDDPWFFEFKNSTTPYTLNIDIDNSLKKLALFINVRTLSGDSLAGIGIDFNEVVKMVRNYKIGQYGMVMITDPEGNMVIHPDLKIETGTPLNQYIGDNISDALLDKNQINVIETKGDSNNLMAAKYIPSLDWFVVAKVPSSELYGPINSTSYQLIIINGLVAIALIAIGLWVAIGVAKPVHKASNMLNVIASGDADLTQKMPVTSKDEVGKLATAFNHFIAQLASLISSVKQSAQSVDERASGLLEATKHTRHNTEQQQQSIDMVAAAINEMGSTVQEIAKNANDTASAAKTTSDESANGKEVVDHTIAGINQLFEKIQEASSAVEKLAQDVGDIGTVLDVIKGVSEQTNLLALNAAIEAARAGEHGRGFAVVADEVRTLAQRTHQSTDEINKMIEKLEGGAKNAVNAIEAGLETGRSSVEYAGKAGESLNNITLAIGNMSDLSIQVATATEEQSSVVNELNTHIQNIKNMSDDTAQQSSKMNEECTGLSDSANSLIKLVNNFKV
ncbi:methyl-accepting chemotaxis protein [Bermanella sp. R86510]|uniref:methyl-accepting chemotaxis protein n=1 Tax=unclassified Bermanella TaxID=2627862 RepID=UPI0037C986E4